VWGRREKKRGKGSDPFDTDFNKKHGQNKKTKEKKQRRKTDLSIASRGLERPNTAG